MSEKSVLFVGLNAAQANSIALPESVVRTHVGTCREALDFLALTPHDAIVANYAIDQGDALDFFIRLLEANPNLQIPVVFVAPEQRGVEPFAYQRRRAGYQVRYLSGAGQMRTHFIAADGGPKDYAVCTLRHEGLGEQVFRMLNDGGIAVDIDGADDGLGSVLDIGFNETLTVEGECFHVQTEVVEAEPLTVACTVFKDGKTLHTERDCLQKGDATAPRVRAQVKALHGRMLERIAGHGFF